MKDSKFFRMATIAARLALQNVECESFQEALTAAGEYSSDSFLKMIKRNRLGPLIFDNLRRCGDFGERRRFDGSFFSFLERSYYDAMAVKVIQDSVLKDLLESCHSSGIETIPFKGASIAGRWYSNPVVRFAGDMDILVRKRDLPAFHNSVTEVGFLAVDSGKPHSWTRTYRHRIHRKAILECQWNLWFNFRLGFSVDQLFEDADSTNLLGIQVKTLSRLHEIALSVFHFSSHHFFRGPILWLHDLYAMLPPSPANDLVLAESLEKFAEDYLSRRMFYSVFELIGFFGREKSEAWKRLFAKNNNPVSMLGDEILYQTALKSMARPKPMTGKALDWKRLVTSLLLLENRSPMAYLAGRIKLKRKERLLL